MVSLGVSRELIGCATGPLAERSVQRVLEDRDDAVGDVALRGCPVKTWAMSRRTSTSRRPVWTLSPLALTVSNASVSLMIVSVFTAAAAATRLPAYVPP